MGAQSTVDIETCERSSSPACPGDAAPGGFIAVEQAVFTSLPSAGASGYRIVSASHGLRPEERQEIVQRCPSHESLTDDGASAEALCSWTFRSGRHAVAWSRHAELEHTGRGGYRVHMQVAVLDTASYERFEFHPVRVYAAMLEAQDAAPADGTESNAGYLHLPDPASTTSAWLSALGIGCNREAIFAILEAVLAGRSVIVTGLNSPFAALDAALAATPLSLRVGLSICTGLKYSPARPARIIVLDGDCEEARRLTRGQAIEWLDAAALPTPPGDTAGGWPEMARRWWVDGRRRQLCQLAARITFEATPAALERIAILCQDADAAETVDAAGVEQLAERYAGFQPVNPLECDLVKRIHSVLSSRSAI